MKSMAKNWKKLITIVLTIFIIFSAFKDVIVEAANDNNPKVVKVGLYNWEGNSGINNKVFFQNYVTEYFAKLTKATGIEFEYENGSWSEVMKKLDDGKVNLVFGALYTKNRSREYAYIRPEVYTKNIDVIALKKEGEENYNDHVNRFQIPGKVFGVIDEENDYYKDILEQNVRGNNNVELNYYKSNAIGIAALRNREIDYIIENSYIYLDKDLKKVGTLTQAKYYLIANNKEEELINILTQEAQEIHESDVISITGLNDKNSVVLNLEEARALEKLPILTFYVAKDNYFYYKKNENGSETGVYAWYMNRISKALHKDYEVIQIDPKDLALQKKTGVYFDLLRNYRYIPNSYGSKELTNSIIKTQVLFVGKKQEPLFGKIKNSLTYVSCDPGYLYMYAKDNSKTILTKNDEESLKLVAYNKADVAIVNYFSGFYLNSMVRYKNISVAGIESNISRALLVVNSKDPSLMGVINKAIGSIPESEFREDIVKEGKKNIYKPTIQEQLMDNFAILISIIGIILIISFFVIRVLINKNKKIEGLTDSFSKASVVKDDFLSRISHDMRTPLNAIISYSDFGIEETKNEANKEYFTNIKENSTALLNLMKDVLELQRINNLGNRIENTRQIVDLNIVFDTLKESIYPLAKQKDIDFVLKKDFAKKNLKYVKVNKVLLNQALSNILVNAIKYTPIGGRVKWVAEDIEIGENLRLKNAIYDNGPGISPEFQKKMFDTFSVGNNTLTNSASGTGLGLAISKNAVDILGGTIKCKSGLGFGTTFVITVPVGRVSESESEEYEANCESSKNILEKNSEELVNPLKIKVLLCEDQLINANIIEKILGKSQIEVTWAKNGAEGLSLFKENRYNLILMDIRMPIMDGLTATCEIRKIDSKIPIIGLSGETGETEIRQALDTGMTDYLEKPIDRKLLIEKITKLTRG